MPKFNKGMVDVEKIVADLYDSSKCGVMSFPGFISEELRGSLEEELRANTDKFVTQPRSIGHLTQELASFEISDFSEFPRVVDLQKEYIGVFQEIARKAEFENGGFNSTVATHYNKGSLGIGYHQDFLSDKNLVSIFVIAGNAGFFVAKARNGYGKREIAAPAGSLVLMRAPRNRNENKLRPYHRVGRVTEERYTIAIRQNTKKLLV